MPRKGWKCINVKEEDYELIEKIAKKRGMNTCYVVALAFQNSFPKDFPHRIEV